MAHTTQLEEALALALQLPPGDRLRLVERVVASVEREIAGSVPATQHRRTLGAGLESQCWMHST